jgi:predicted O-methyltransferase YrrM
MPESVTHFQHRQMSMTRDQWTAVDAYINDTLLGAGEALDHVLEASAAAGLPSIAVAPNQGKLLFILAKSIGATRILELGTLGGYSGIWLARALPPDGRLVTVEADPRHADVARMNFERAGVANLVDLRIGPALEVLPRLAAERAGPFDFVFIDADKGNYAEYLDWAIRLCRPGSLIVADNIVRKGAVMDEASEDPLVRGVRRFMDRLGADRRVTATAIQTVGVKGYDGLALIRVESV